MNQPMNQSVRSKLLDLRRRDESTRTRLMESGELFDGYSDDMEAVHLENAAELDRLIEEHGWPGVSLVGEEGCEAAWLVAQHTISRPEMQRRFLDELAAAIAAGEAPPWQLAYLTDRIRVNSRQRQIFGTQLDWDDSGELSPGPIEAPGEVDKRRAEVGLVPLAEAVELAREHARQAGHEPPVERERSQRRQEEWARRVGWIE